MFRALLKLTHSAAHYMGHPLSSKVQPEEIEILKSELKQDQTKVLIFMNHKQKILQIKYREGQMEHYGEKGICMLATMIVQWVTKTIKVSKER